ncbi:MAG: acetolactate decarboxylase [Miltoncostaeaceae bacterium]
MSEGPELFQVSTLAALAHGANRGGITVAELLEHGEFGIGTFEGLDGEMVVLDGVAHRVMGHEYVGSAGSRDVTPYAAVTRFEAHAAHALPPLAGVDELFAALDRLRPDADHVAAVRVDGRFSRIGLRVACPAREGETLAEAAAHQYEARHRDLSATILGFWTPEALLGVDVVGYHLHVISEDRTMGGHLIDAAGDGLVARVQIEGRLTIVGDPVGTIDPEQLADDLGMSEDFRDS